MSVLRLRLLTWSLIGVIFGIATQCLRLALCEHKTCRRKHAFVHPAFYAFVIAHLPPMTKFIDNFDGKMFALIYPVNGIANARAFAHICII